MSQNRSPSTQNHKNQTENPETYRRIKKALRHQSIHYEELGPHEASLTCNDSARIRQSLGWTKASIHSGAKSMLLKNKKYRPSSVSTSASTLNDHSKNTPIASQYILTVLSASKKLDWKAIKKHPMIDKAKGLTMATPEEVNTVTGCLSGAVPPFSVCFPYCLDPNSNYNDAEYIPVFVDESLKLQGDVIHFNCGLRTHSMQMNFEDYVDLAKPILAHFSVKEI